MTKLRIPLRFCFDSVRLSAIVGLLVTCAVWGSSFSSIKICGEILAAGTPAGTSPAFGPLFLTALRFTAALPVAIVLFRGSRPWQINHAQLGPVLKVGLAMAAGFLTQAAGLAWATATISAFLTSLTVCAVPGLEWAFFKKIPTLRLFLAVLLATMAVSLMSLPGARRWAFGPGEILTLLCAMFFALQVVWTGDSARRVGVGRLTVACFAITGLISWILLFTAFPACSRSAILYVVYEGPARRFWRHFAWIVLGPTLGAMTTMNACQRHVRPTEAAVIYTTEPLFAALFALVLRGREELLGAAGFVGAGLILAADLLAALPEKFSASATLSNPTPGERKNKI
ncbi:MAG: DMT family transporter [Kiritimatiellae bacterium]|nr:DMT family transporter [Kiritimatiellia bacterium]